VNRVDARWRAWRSVLEVASFVTQRIDEDLRDQVGIDIQTYDALLHTKEAGEAGIRMTDLADRVLLSKPGLTALVDRLEDRGLLARQPERHDRRVKRIVLTPTGWDLFRQAATVHTPPSNSGSTSTSTRTRLNPPQRRSRWSTRPTSPPNDDHRSQGSFNGIEEPSSERAQRAARASEVQPLSEGCEAGPEVVALPRVTTDRQDELKRSISGYPA
jgi:DNA-binding MarR family transcriptional regulator